MAGSRPTVWITRTAPAAYESAKKFKTLGLEPVVAPLLEIVPPSNLPKPPRADDTIIFTSRNGVTAFAELTDLRIWPVITVGDATAQQARDAGFEKVTSASGDNLDVIALVKSNIRKSQNLVHYSGEQIRGNITKALSETGYKARREILYRSVPVSQCPNVGKSDFVALYSPMAARTLAGFDLDMSNGVALTISPATAEALGVMKLKDVRIAQTPDEAAILDLLTH